MKYKWVVVVIGVFAFGLLLWLMLTIKWANRNFSFEKKQDINMSVNQKIYIANEWESAVSVIDADKNTVIKTISLTEQYYGKLLSFSAHNVQVWPKGTVVVITANIKEDEKEWHTVEETNNDELVIIDPLTDTVIWRVSLDKWAHLAHAVISHDDSTAYVTSQDKWKVYVVDLTTKKVKQTVVLPDWAQPHWLRLSANGTTLYVALIGERWIAKIDTVTYTSEIIPLNWKVIQVAVTPDNKYVFASLYNAKSIARYEIASKEVKTVSLPEWSVWPIQLYSTPDSAYIYVADQWYYFDEPVGSSIYKIDANSLDVVEKYIGWEAPHGVVISPNGEKTYVTNLLSNTVTVINNIDNKVESTIPVGKMPNGISIWTNWIGWTP